MGSTIVAGAVTTAGGGVFMLVCQMQFFTKMGLMIVLTILFSFVYTFGFFIPSLLMFGAAHEEGDLHWFFESLSVTAQSVFGKIRASVCEKAALKYKK